MPGLSSLASRLSPGIGSLRTSSVMLLEVEEYGRPVIRDGKASALAFQYFPETISDNKSVDYQAKSVPGGSLPIYQWTSSGERPITFTAVFTSDLDLTEIDNPADLNASGISGRNVDIRSAITWLRQFMLPEYVTGEGATGSVMTVAPARLKLIIPNSGIGSYGGDDGGYNGQPDAVLCHMTQCDVTFESFFISGLPRIATVSLGFNQIAQLNGDVSFPHRSAKMRDRVNGNSEFNGYRIYSRIKR